MSEFHPFETAADEDNDYFVFRTSSSFDTNLTAIVEKNAEHEERMSAFKRILQIICDPGLTSPHRMLRDEVDKLLEQELKDLEISGWRPDHSVPIKVSAHREFCDDIC